MFNFGGVVGGLVVWIPLWKGVLLRGIPGLANHQFTIRWFVKVWNYPPLRNSHHQDYLSFSRKSNLNLHLWLLLGSRLKSKVLILFFSFFGNVLGILGSQNKKERAQMVQEWLWDKVRDVFLKGKILSRNEEMQQYPAEVPKCLAEGVRLVAKPVVRKVVFEMPLWGLAKDGPDLCSFQSNRWDCLEFVSLNQIDIKDERSWVQFVASFSMRQPPKPKDLFMLFLMCESPKFAAVWHLNISTLRLPKHLFSRSMRYRSLQHVRQLLFCSFTWKAAMATCCSAHRTPLEDYMVSLKRADPGDQSWCAIFPIVYVAAGISPILHDTKVRGRASRITTIYVMAAMLFRQLSSQGVYTDPGRALALGPKSLQVSRTKWKPLKMAENSQCIQKEANGSAMFCSSELFNLVWYYNFCTSVSDISRFSNVSFVEIYHEDQRKAIASIPAYILQCEFFVALCPDLRHHDSSSPLLAEKVCWCRSEDSWHENFQLGMMAMVWFFWSRVPRTCFLAFRRGKPC